MSISIQNKSHYWKTWNAFALKTKESFLDKNMAYPLDMISNVFAVIFFQHFDTDSIEWSFEI